MNSLLRCLGILQLLLLVSCVYVSPMQDVPLARLSNPVLNTVAVHGLEFRDERVAGRSVSVATSNTVSQGSANSRFGYGGVASSPQGTAIISGSGSGSTNYAGSSATTSTAQAVQYETFDSAELIQELRRALEDCRAAEVVTFNDGDLHLVGAVLDAGPSTGAGRIIWNVFDCVSLICLLGGPILGTCDATVELRAYQGEKFLASYRGEGRASWRAHYGFLITIPQGKADARRLAAKLAVRDAVSKLIADPPTR